MTKTTVPNPGSELLVLGLRVNLLRRVAVVPVLSAPPRPSAPGQPQRGHAGVGRRRGSEQRAEHPDQPTDRSGNLAGVDCGPGETWIH